MFSRFNNLTVKIFTLFWLIFILLVMLAFLIPRFDARLITPLQANDMSLYQREIASSIQNNKFSRLLILSNQLIPDNTGELRPILVDKNGNIIGAKENELASILDFVHNSNEPAKPMQKVFYDI
ncbi:MAG TPA: two-component system sensor histidine kinase CpxA, partial [Pasteurellaceae bacterium]|nr:two-component system sensor histidine kinase CpxA [Pasteurellaceae bacterium]